MSDRPYTVLSCSMSLDRHLDDATDRRLVLSDDADPDRVDELRSEISTRTARSSPTARATSSSTARPGLRRPLGTDSRAWSTAERKCRCA